MQKNNMEYRILRLSLVLTLLGTVIFLALIPINYSLSIGWLAGAFSVILGYSVGILLTKKLFSKKNSKVAAFFIGWFRFNLVLILQGGLFIAVVAIDKSFNGHGFIEGGMTDMYTPINVFTYIGGVSLIFISTLVAQFLSRKEGNNGSRKERRIFR